MFSMFKADPIKKLRKEHSKKLEQGMLAQRNGDMKGFAQITTEAESLWAKIQQLESEKK